MNELTGTLGSLNKMMIIKNKSLQDNQIMVSENVYEMIKISGELKNSVFQGDVSEHVNTKEKDENTICLAE